MRFEKRLVEGRLLRRYKRFLADVELPDGRVVVAHVPNTGSMLSTRAAGSPVAISYSPAPHRKLDWTLELVGVPGGHWVGVHTGRTNRVVEEAIAAGRIGSMRGRWKIRREVPYGLRSRIDLLLERRDARCYVEVKNVTYRVGRAALFPDAVTERGTRHLEELQRMVARGHRAVALFLVNRPDCASMSPASTIDPTYSATLAEATARGVEALAYRTRPTLDGISVEEKIPVRLPR